MKMKKYEYCADCKAHAFKNVEYRVSPIEDEKILKLCSLYFYKLL